MKGFALWVFSAVLLVVAVQGQQCVPPSDPALAPALSVFYVCRNWGQLSFPTSIYVNSNRNLTDDAVWAQRIVDALKGNSYNANLPTSDKIGTNFAMLYLCSVVFPGCVVAGNPPVNVPQPVNLSVCEGFDRANTGPYETRTNQVRVSLGAAYSYLNRLFNMSASTFQYLVPACNATAPAASSYPSVLPGSSVFSYSAVQMALSATQTATVAVGPGPGAFSPNFAVICFNNQTTQNVDGYRAFQFTDKYVQNVPYCRVDCPGWSYTEYVWNGTGTAMIVGGWLGFFLSIIFIVIRLIQPKYRAYPNNLVAFLGVTVLIISIAAIMPSFVGGWRNVVCPDYSTVNFQAITGLDWLASPPPKPQGLGGPWNRFLTGTCTAQAAFWAFGTWAFSSWWAAIAVHAALATILGPSAQEKFTKWTHLATHLVCWGVPFIFLIASLADPVLISQKDLPWCGFSPSLAMSDSEQWVLQSLWLFLCMLIGTVCIVVVIVQLTRNLGTAKFAVVQNVRLIIFLLLLWMVQAYRIAYRVSQFKLVTNFIAFNGLWQDCNTFADGCNRAGARQDPALPWLLTFSEFYFQTIAVVILFCCSTDLWLGLRDVLTGKTSISESYNTGGSATTAGATSSSASSGSDTGASSWLDA